MTRALAERLWRVVDAFCFALALLLLLAVLMAPQLYAFITGV